MPELNHKTILHAPVLAELPRTEWTIFVDGEGPNWVSTDERGAWLLQQLGDAPTDFSTLVGRYAARWAADSGKAWVHAHAFISDALRHGILSLEPVRRQPYEGRARYLDTVRLRECWLHTNNSCNLSCAHCLVNSSPQGEPGLSTAFWRTIIDQAVALGVERFYITGGEPFVRQDLPELIQRITKTHHIEVVVLTNATLFAGPRKALLDALDREQVKFQVSVDGSTPDINDPIRGRGSFAATVDGLKELARLKNLRSLELSFTNVTDAGLKELRVALPKCSISKFGEGH